MDTIENAPLLGDSWQHRLLERVARELGILVHQLSEHPGAFSTYLKTQETPLYVGLSSSSLSLTHNPTERPASSNHQSVTSPSGVLFAPTLQNNQQSEASLWGIEEEPEPEEMLARQSASADAATIQQEREYWERELDVKMVFNFLKNRFSSHPNSPEAANDIVPYPGASALESPRHPSAYTSSKQSALRAALIRQHHPLADQQHRRKDSGHRHHHAHHQPKQRLGVRTRSDSCASQSTKKSRKSGSVGSGPASWGEVGI